ncbi:MAG: von Willebrand factor type A domain-containing protein, partial [Planctomycetes bacterium]|nr:von Willebrand factor type A domain-containing protein [Planctomycetota bacterium]
TGGMSGSTGGCKLTEQAEKARSGRAGARLPYSENLAEINKQARPIAELPTVLLKGFRGEEPEVPPLAITKGHGTLPGGKSLGRLFDDRAQPDADESRRSSNSYTLGKAEKSKKQLARKPPPRPGKASAEGWAVIDGPVPEGGERRTVRLKRSIDGEENGRQRELLRRPRPEQPGTVPKAFGETTIGYKDMADYKSDIARGGAGRHGGADASVMWSDGSVAFDPPQASETPPRQSEKKKSGGLFGFLGKKRSDYRMARKVSPKDGRLDEFGIPSEQAPWGQEAGVAVRGKRGHMAGVIDVLSLPNTRTGEVAHDREREFDGEFGRTLAWETAPGRAARTLSIIRGYLDGRNVTEFGGLFLDAEGLHKQRIAELVWHKDRAADKGRADEPDDAPAFVKLSPDEALTQDARKQANAPVDALTTDTESKPELTVEEELPDDEPMPPAVFKLVPVNPFVMTGKDRFSTFALDVDTASYALARSYIRRGYLPPAGSVRMEEFVNAFDYNYPKHTENVFTVHAEGMPSPFGRGLVLLKIGVQGRALGREGRKPAHLVFVVDASGSMARPDRLPLVQHGLALLAEQLGERDRVSLVTFGSGATLLLQGAPAADKPRMLAAVNSIRCGGSTNLLQGVELGYAVAAREFRAGEINRVILCSDGMANIGLTDADDMLGQVEAFKKQGISFTSIGFGTGSYNDELLEKLANKGDGTYAFIASRSEARRVFVDQMATLQTIAGDAKIQVEFDPARVRRYRLVGYENRDVADKDFRNDAIDAGEVGSGQSATALYELELLGPAKGCKPRDLGTVYVRYRNLDTNKIEEISSRLESSLIRRQTVRAAPRLYLAAAAAELAEILRQSEHAQGGSLDSVKSIVEHVAAELPLDQRVSELLNLATRARGLPRAQ